MPLYEYQCRRCGERFEILQRMGEGADGVACPRCGEQRVERQLSTFSSSVGDSIGSTAAGACGAGSGFR